MFFFWCLGVGRFFLLLDGGRVLFFAVWVGVVLFLLFGRLAGSFFLLFGRVSFVCCCLGGWHVFLLFGRVACFLLLFVRGTGVHSLTGLPGSSVRDQTTKKTKQQKKNTGSGRSKP